MSRGERPRKIQHHQIQDAIAKDFKEEMEQRGLSPEKLGKLAKVGRKSVERLMAGQNSTLTTLGAVADQLGLELLVVRKRTARTTLVSGDAAAQHRTPSDSSAKRNRVGK
jgi:hypothetical protein